MANQKMTVQFNLFKVFYLKQNPDGTAHESRPGDRGVP